MSTTVSLNSELALANEVFKLCDAGGSVIQVRTRETGRAAVALRFAILSDDTVYSHTEWDVINGMRNFTLENYADGFVRGVTPPADFFTALELPLNKLRDASSDVNTSPNKTHVFVFVDPHPYIQGNPIAAALIQQYAALLPSRNVCLIFVTPYQELQGLPQGTLLVADMPTPCQDELVDSLSHILDSSPSEYWDSPPDFSEEELARVAALGLGMTKFEFETHASLAIVQSGIDQDSVISFDSLMRGIAAGKTEVVKQSDMLELFPCENMGDVGGMQRLKDWVNARAGAFSEEARAFGVESPKGVALVGIPGAGKSLVAKAIAGAWGVPLIRLDFGAVFSKFVGESEARMREALKMVEQMGRLVLFADEIDKALGGVSSGNDSGISARVLGSFLTWMQETECEVFVVLTANRIEGLPPEIFRKGRMDEVFSVGLPTANERVEVLGVHLRKRQRSIEEYSDEELHQFRENSTGMVPAEIESAVKAALVTAYNAREDEEDFSLPMQHILNAIAVSVPMSVSHKEQITKILEWAENNATPVSYPDSPLPVVSSSQSRRVARPSTQRPPRRPTQH